MATIALCSYFLAKSVTLYLAVLLESGAEPSVAVSRRPPAGAGPEWPEEAAARETYEIIAERNIFNSKALKAAEANTIGPQQLGMGGEAVKTGLDVKLRSTMRVGDGTDRRSSVIIAVGKARGRVYFVDGDESFAPNVRLVRVGRRQIKFLNAGRLEYAELEEFKKSVFRPPEEVFGKFSPFSQDSKDKQTATDASPSSNAIIVDQRDVDNALQNLDRLQREVRIVPNFQAGRIAGFKVLSVRPGGLISKLGVRRGDVLESVNGEVLDVQRGLELFNSLKDSRSFSLGVMRGGRPMMLEYEIR